MLKLTMVGASCTGPPFVYFMNWISSIIENGNGKEISKFKFGFYVCMALLVFDFLDAKFGFSTIWALPGKALGVQLNA